MTTKNKRWFVIVELNQGNYHSPIPYVAVFRGSERGAEEYANLLLGEGNYIVLPVSGAFVDEDHVDWEGLARAAEVVARTRWGDR